MLCALQRVQLITVGFGHHHAVDLAAANRAQRLLGFREPLAEVFDLAIGSSGPGGDGHDSSDSGSSA
ncbi:MAG: hypothetical protein WA208_04460 [Thermoanaerobaculia bacterium]